MTDMSTETKRAFARDLLNNPIYQLVMNELETSAINQAVNAGRTDDQTRAAMMAEVRAIRNLATKLNLYSQEASSPKGAPA